ncbi:MAG: SAM-dependent methyltransferase [Acidimicrobiales bacterium]|nr:SAM-dependent methyltransferase [Acidimicrobiales bacterium]
MKLELSLSKDHLARSAEASQALFSSIVSAGADGRLDPSALRVRCDWIQYRSNFREPVTLRPLAGGQRHVSELAVDLRQIGAEDADALLAQALSTNGAGPARHFLEPWAPISKSCIWEFNAHYWSELALWEQASGKGYEQVLPGGQSGGTQADATREVIWELLRTWDALAERHALPDQLTILELGVGNGAQARVWLDEFRTLDREHGTDYYRRVHYLMADYSTHVLDRAREHLSEHRARTSTIVLDAARPSETLRFLERRIFFVFISNVYDNLSTDELARVDDELFQVEVRAYLPNESAERIAASLGVSPPEVVELIARLRRLGPALLAETAPDRFRSAAEATAFWQEVWGSLRLAERYVPLGPLDLYTVCDGVSGEVLGPVIDGYGDVRFQVSNGAAASFVDTLPLLHPLGSLVCHDLFITDLDQCRSGFRGPGKYDGSVVNWVNGPILAAIAARQGYSVSFRPFSQQIRSTIVTMTARARD